MQSKQIASYALVAYLDQLATHWAYINIPVRVEALNPHGWNVPIQ